MIQIQVGDIRGTGHKGFGFNLSLFSVTGATLKLRVFGGGMKGMQWIRVLLVL